MQSSDKQSPWVATSRALRQLAGLPELLNASVVSIGEAKQYAECQGVIAWGRKPSAHKATAYAQRHGLKVLRLEDGFLRSVDLGSKEPPLSIVLDDEGIYYDAASPSRLETLIAAPLDARQRARAVSLVEQWRGASVSKYNHNRNYSGPLPPDYVLVADQTRGDAAIGFGLADASSFNKMLAAALEEYPDCSILLKVHPEVMNGSKQGHFDLDAIKANPRVSILAEDVHPASLIKHAKAIYAVTSQIGFEGLLWGKPVHTFGMPFYAGWGLTSDDLPAPTRRKCVTIEQLIHACLVDYPRYIDPELGSSCEVERIIEWMGLQRRVRERFPTELSAAGFSWYKQSIVRSFLQGSQIHFVRSPEQTPDPIPCALWGAGREVKEDMQQRLLRMEDGFLRSVGLGADLIAPLSWVIDGRGIYYDATKPSDLEYILQQQQFDAPLQLRSARLRERLVAEGLTKYNVGISRQEKVHERYQEITSTGKRLILVPGQVESDASLACGAPGIRRNLDLLRAVRKASPDAHVIYKPHPDVVAGLRRIGDGEDESSRFCNEVVTDMAMGELLPLVDEVHVLTSLAGFEALLRGKKVVCYGQPFYAGWGLTEDMIPVSRRTRRLSLDELVAGVLILYPVYVSRITGRFTTPEQAMNELLEWRQREGTDIPFWRRIFRIVLRMTVAGK